MIGIAFSIGFLVGPSVGARFAVWAKRQNNSQDWFVYPAFVALTLSILDFIYIALKFKETLPQEKRLKSLDEAIQQAFTYINPVSLFNFESIKNLKDDEKASLRTIGKNHALKKYDQFALNTSCFWGILYNILCEMCNFTKFFLQK